VAQADGLDRECDVVVVGAGFAGLSAARQLARAGLDVTVVEARDRVGGRSWTITSDTGALVDQGGQWIGPGQHHLEALAAEFGVESFATYTAGDAVEWRDGQRHTYSGLIPTADAEAAADTVEHILDLDLAAMEVPLDAPWLAEGAAAADGQTLASWMRSNIPSAVARDILTVGIKAVFGTEPDELSLLFVLFYLHSGGGLARLARTTGGAQERRFVGGSQQLVEALAAELGSAVKLSAPVSSIEHGPNHVVVRGVQSNEEGGQTPYRIEARRAIVAMPPSLSARLDWSPPLPGVRDQLSMRMPMGTVTKMHAIYDTPFWREEGLNGQLVTNQGYLSSGFDDSPIDGSHGALVGFIAGNESRQLEAVGPSGRAAVVRQELERAFGPKAASPLEIIEQHWPAEPFTRGGPVTICVPGALTGFGVALRQPVNAVHWAGTETATEWCGYMDGAISSGLRAAEEVVVALGHKGESNGQY
jgi:monoamine oxidase